MPFKNPEDKKEWTERWRKQSIANGYGKWLYHKRALHYADADHFREALKAIAVDFDCSDSQQLARDALQASAERWETLGPSPETHVGVKRRRTPKQPDDTLLEAVARLGLE